jgi:adenylate cyclase
MKLPDLTQRQAERVDQGLAREALDSLTLGLVARSMAIVVIAVSLAVERPLAESGYYFGALGAFMVLGFVHRSVAARLTPATWPGYIFIVADFCLLTYVLASPNPLSPDPLPPQFLFRLGTFPYFFVLLAGTVLSYSPRQVIFAGITAALAWSATMIWTLYQPGVLTPSHYSDWWEAPSAVFMARFLDPLFVHVPARIQEGVILIVVAGILAAVVARTRRMVMRQVHAERERANLARYLSPNMVDELASSEGSLGTSGEQNVAILFADIVGFTQLCEGKPAEEVVTLLRRFHALLAAEVFEHNGTLDKYLGDGLMATFGTPRPSALDGTNALGAALGMIDAIERWNAERIATGEVPIPMGVGVHYGPVIIGDIGDERRLEHAVIGDAVNVASRVEQLTRDLRSPLLVSQELIEAVKAENGGGSQLLARFVDAGVRRIRGRGNEVRLWMLADRSWRQPEQ